MTGSLKRAAAEYLRLRSSLGRGVNEDERYFLEKLLAFRAARRDAGPITAQLVVEWLRSNGSKWGIAWQRRGLCVVRGFVEHLQVQDVRHECPGGWVLPPYCRPRPFLFTEVAIVALEEALERYPFHQRLGEMAYRTIIGLMLSCGLRMREAIRLTVCDVRLDGPRPHLVVTKAKFRKERLVPIHSTTARALRRYRAARIRARPADSSSPFLITRSGTHFTKTSVHRVFRELVLAAGLKRFDGEPPPMHSLRHTFASERLAKWYEAGVDVNVRLHWLSLYMGHDDPADTYWYLSTTPALLEQVGRRLESAGTSTRPALVRSAGSFLPSRARRLREWRMSIR